MIPSNFQEPTFKMVICGKYKNLNKITKFLTYLPEILQTSYFCYSLQFTMRNRGTCCLKMCFNTDRSKGIFAHENLKKNSIVNQNALNAEGFLMHLKGYPSSCFFFQLLLTL